jgi:hypothetical protein
MKYLFIVNSRRLVLYLLEIICQDYDRGSKVQVSDVKPVKKSTTPVSNSECMLLCTLCVNQTIKEHR